MKDSPRGFEIVVATKKNIVGLAFYGLIIIVLACIEGIIIYFFMGMTGNAHVIIMVILAAVTIYAVHYVYWWFWKVAGKECILITRNGFLSIKRDIFGFGYNYRYHLNKITGLRVVSNLGITRHQKRGIIAFEHESDTYHFGYDVDELEAQVIIDELSKHSVFKAG